MKKLIIFDWDDVFMLGATRGYYRCYHEAVKSVGVVLTPEEEERRIKAKWGASHIEELQELLQEAPELVDKAAQAYDQHLHGSTFVDSLEVVHGSQDLLRRLADHYKLAVATGAHPDVLRDKVFPKFDIPDVFSWIMTVYDLDNPAHAKPHPYMLNRIIEMSKISPAEALVVGDAPGDMKMARRAGIEPVAVLTGHLSRREAESLGVEYIVNTVVDLEEILEKINTQ